MVGRLSAEVELAGVELLSAVLGETLLVAERIPSVVVVAMRARELSFLYSPFFVC